MRRAILLFLFLIPSVIYAQNHAQYKNKTNEQLSGLRRGQTNITWDTFINNFFGPLNSAIQRQFKESYIIGYDYPDIQTAISAIGSNRGAITIVDSQTVTQSSRYTIPSNISVFVTDAGFLYLNNQLTINGKFYAGSNQCFKGNIDSVKFAPGSVDYVRPEWFGAKADGLSNSTLSINYAIKSISGSGIPILLDSGIYLVDSIRVNIEQIENNNINFGISGISGNTVISPYLTPSDTFIVIGDNSQVSSRSGRRINITNIRIQGQRGWNDTTKVNSIALWLDQLQDVEMRNVFISSFAGGLALYDIWDSNFYDIQIMHCGVDSVRPALLLKTATNNSNALRFFGLHIEHARNAIYIDRNNRHIYFIGGKFEFSDLTSISQPSYPYIIIHENANEVSFIGNQFVVGRQPNTSEPYAIEVRNSYTKFIGNDFTTNYPSIIGAKWIDASKADPIKITSNTFDYAWGGQYSIKLGNNAIFSNNDVFVDSTSGARYGIWMNSENKVVYNNIKGLPDTGTLNAGIMFFAAGTGNIIEANRVYGVVDTMYYATDFGNNFFAPIFDDQFSILDVNSQTPDVSLNNNYITANTIATNITNFSNSSEGKRLTIHFGDANTVVKNGSTIKLSNGVDFVPRVGDVLYLENRGGVWYEIGRNPLLAINTQTKFFEFKVIADTLCAISGADTTRLVPSR